MKHDANAAETAVRIDKWLWAARFFKSRSIAVTAIEGGKVLVNGDRVKPSREVKAGDTVRVRLGPYEHGVVVRAISDRRGPAAQAALLFEETAESRAAREKLHWQLKHAAPLIEPGEGRPTKKDRRALNKFKGF
jgi:ribosome-associated heat shock protein Hsp15